MFLIQAIQHHWLDSLGDSTWPGLRRAVHLGVPASAGSVALAAHGLWAHQMDLVAIVSIITGLLFSLLAFLVQLRYDIRRQGSQQTVNQRDARNVDFAFQSSVYAIIVGLVEVAFIFCQRLLQRHIEQVPHLALISNWVIYSFFGHFVMTVWTCLRRLWRLYDVLGLNQA